jgi:hypothetical protein
VRFVPAVYAVCACSCVMFHLKEEKIELSQPMILAFEMLLIIHYRKILLITVTLCGS